MSKLLPEDIPNNEDGFVLVTALLVLLVLLIIGMTSTRSTNVEKQISANDRLEKQEFFNQETCLATAKVTSATWLTINFISAGETSAFFPPTVSAANDLDGDGINDLSEINDPNGITLASYEARSMESSGTAIVGISNQANNFPSLAHKDKPPPGSGYSPKNFEIRRYIVTCQSPTTARNAVLQEGVYKVFNKF